MERKFVEPWNRIHGSVHAVWTLEKGDLARQISRIGSYLPYGRGLSYGDSCLNANGGLVRSGAFDQVTCFDERTGVVRCGSGTSLATINERVIPSGWVLPVSPATARVTVGGATAHDVHGRNHPHRGTWGRHVVCFELVRSDGDVLRCSRKENSGLFRATIGGMGMTGFVSWVELQLQKVPGPFVKVRTIPFSGYREFLQLRNGFQVECEYLTAWWDLTRTWELRGVVVLANHTDQPGSFSRPRSSRVSVVGLPFSLVNRTSSGLLNRLFLFQNRRIRESVQTYTDTIYTLDKVKDWNRLLGPRGFFQYQFVIPEENIGEIETILRLVKRSGLVCFLGVVKNFGEPISPGLMSFPMPGLSLALDFVNEGTRTLSLFNELDQRVLEAGGRVYLAKDSRLRPETFHQFYPQWKEMAPFLDPACDSNLLRRINA